MLWRTSRKSCKISRGVSTPPGRVSTPCVGNIPQRSWLVWVHLSLTSSRLTSLWTSFLPGRWRHCKTVFSSSSMVRNLNKSIVILRLCWYVLNLDILQYTKLFHYLLFLWTDIFCNLLLISFFLMRCHASYSDHWVQNSLCFSTKQILFSLNLHQIIILFIPCLLRFSSGVPSLAFRTEGDSERVLWPIWRHSNCGTQTPETEGKTDTELNSWIH